MSEVFAKIINGCEPILSGEINIKFSLRLTTYSKCKHGEKRKENLRSSRQLFPSKLRHRSGVLVGNFEHISQMF